MNPSSLASKRTAFALRRGVELSSRTTDKIKVMSANCGDSRVLLIKDGQPPVQLSVDHVPDLESERQRIEDQKARNSKCVPSPALAASANAHHHARLPPGGV